MIKVGVCGACGKMGKEVVKNVLASSDMKLVAAIDIANAGQNISEIAGFGDSDVKVMSDLKAAIVKTAPDVIVDFTQPASIFENAKICITNGVRPVIGTTGLSSDEIAELKRLSEEKNISVFIAPNFTTGAVLMMMFSKMAAKYFDNAEIIELHHNQKKDAPSGTAIKTAEMMCEANKSFATGNCPEKETYAGARGANVMSDIRIHSVRMPGYIASQEVIFGASGQILKIRHDSMDRTCYMAGVNLAIRYVMENKNFTYGLDNIL